MRPFQPIAAFGVESTSWDMALILTMPFLNATLTRFSNIRDARIRTIVERLNTLGIDLALTQVNDQVGDGVAGRPHVAAAMIKAGYARDVDDAFDRFLGNDRPGICGQRTPRLPHGA